MTTSTSSRAAPFAALLLGLGLALGACGGSDSPTCTPVAELCNGQDDDCDGTVDDGFDAGAACTVGVGACQVSGQRVCTSSGAATICDATPGAPGVETCNGIDDDCDGAADQELADCCAPAATRACGAGVGVCVAGTQTCSAARAWGECLDGGGQPVAAPGERAELCNGVDDDCDGEVDELNAADCTLFHQDADEDGFGLAAVCACGPAGQFTATQGLDCDDQNAAAYPGAVEACDGADNDCDGQADEVGAQGCATYYADADQDGYGDGMGDAASACLCAPSSPFTATVLGDCDPANPGRNLGAVEACNAADDDCDGLVDEGLPPGATCSVGVGACEASGFEVCQSGQNTCSATPLPPQEEVCNGLDDDCNGTVDGVAPQACYTGPAGTAGVGACRGGTRACVSGAFTACQGEVLPQLESCNGVDDDCDGQADEGIAASGSCSAGVGACLRSGQLTCQAASFTCNAVPGEPAAEICNGLDDDCNGTVDEVPSLDCYSGPAGTAGVGACHQGTQICSFGAYGACQGEVVPQVEVCNGVDDNCDGQVDETGTADCTTWYVDNDNDGWGTNSSACLCAATGVLRATRPGDCDDSDAGVSPGAAEACNGRDDDCDTAVDESVPTPACPLQQGVCAGAVMSCVGGAYQACGAAEYGPEYSPSEFPFPDCLDNNCNGMVDEGFPPGTPCL